MRVTALLLLCLTPSLDAFQHIGVPKTKAAPGLRPSSRLAMAMLHSDTEEEDSTTAVTNKNEQNNFPKQFQAIVPAIITTFSVVSPSIAAGPDWGLFEGRTGSLLHPVMMFSMLAFSISTAVLGFQWRRQRTMGDDISALKKTLPSFEGSSLKEAIANSEDASVTATLKAALPIEKEIQELTAERKELAAAGPRDKHFGQGSLLVFLGTAAAIGVRQQ
jgi:hypothetical protein